MAIWTQKSGPLHPPSWPLAILCMASMTIGVATSGGQEKSPEWNVRDHIPLPEFVVQAHRGAGALMPENSIEAFDLAWQLRTIPEADLRTSRDGVIVAFHDADFQRIMPGASEEARKRGVADLDWEELRALDIGSWKGPEYAHQRIARMTDVYQVLQQHPRRRLYVDIKNVDLEQLARESRAVQEQLILASTKYEIIREWKRLAPHSKTLHWMGGTEAELARRLERLEGGGFADIDQLQIHVRVGEDGSLTPRAEVLAAAGDRLRRHGVLFQTLAWDRKDAETHWKLMDLGVASFATDYPDAIMKAIRDYYARKDR